MTVIQSMQQFGLTDDQILEIALLVDEEGLMAASNRLRAYAVEKYNMSLHVAANTVKGIRKELGCELNWKR